MAKARRKVNNYTNLPGVSDWRECGEILRTTTNFHLIHCGQRDAFFEEMYTRSGHGNRLITALIFAHHPTVQRMTPELNEVLVNISPINGDHSLLTLHHHMDRTARLTPLVYVLLNGKSLEMYSDIFAHFREKLNILPAVIISDSLYDCVHSSLAMTFPEANIKANWFEYVGSIAKELSTVPREVFKDATNKSILRMILVLPFLPADYMAPGLEAIRKLMRDKGVEGHLVSLCRYVEVTWLRGIGAGKLSMFRVSISGEDHLKEFHKEVRASIEKSSSIVSSTGVWQSIHGLTGIAAKYISKYNKRKPQTAINEKKRGSPGAIKKNHVLSEAIIRNATEQWIMQPIHLRSPLQFLQMASHFITTPFMTNVLWHGYEMEEAEEELEEVFVQKEPEKQKQQPPIEMVNNVLSSCCYNPPPVRVVPIKEPPPLTFLPQILDQAKASLRKRRAPVGPTEPPPLIPIIRNNK